MLRYGIVPTIPRRYRMKSLGTWKADRFVTAVNLLALLLPLNHDFKDSIFIRKRAGTSER